MSKMIANIRALAAGIFLLASAAASHAAVLDWSTVTWGAGSVTNSYNVDGVAGNDITVSYTTSGPVTFQNSTPSINASMNGVGPALAFDVSSLNTTGTVSVTITFLGTYAPAKTVSFSLIDVDARFPSATPTNYFQDKITLSALRGGTAVPLTVTGGGEPTISGSGTTSPFAVGTAPIGDATGNVNVSQSGTTVNSITFVWSNPSAYTGTQIIGLGNITFTAVPEIGTGSAVLCLCGGLLLLGRRRVRHAAA